MTGAPASKLKGPDLALISGCPVGWAVIDTLTIAGCVVFVGGEQEQGKLGDLPDGISLTPPESANMTA